MYLVLVGVVHGDGAVGDEGEGERRPRGVHREEQLAERGATLKGAPARWRVGAGLGGGVGHQRLAQVRRAGLHGRFGAEGYRMRGGGGGVEVEAEAEASEGDDDRYTTVTRPLHAVPEGDDDRYTTVTRP